MSSLIQAMKIAGTSLRAQRSRMNTISSNLANAETTKTPDGGPYKRLDPVFQAVPMRFDEHLGQLGAVEEVEVGAIVEDQKPARLVYDPSHPDANENGYVAMPNVNVVQEMVDMVSASRSYEASTSSIKAAKNMARAALEIAS
ncbi:MAG: flagellar basal body rod protein FlgC [Myxococcota bacterium]|nr:flagellar basal body rod protein FlgC [Myxococcota bacterium]